MKKAFSIVGLVGAMVLFLIAPVGALVVVNNDFSNAGQWYSGNYNSANEGWGENGGWVMDNYNNGENYYARLLATNTSGTSASRFGQVIGFPGASGTICLSFDVRYYNLETSIADTFQVTVWGKNEQPASGSWWGSTSAFGTKIFEFQIGPISGGINQSITNWTTKTFEQSDVPAYNWYTIVFYGYLDPPDTYGLVEDLHIDNVYLTGSAVSAVPIPPTVWLLGAGLVGLAGLRRKFFRK